MKRKSVEGPVWKVLGQAIAQAGLAAPDTAVLQLLAKKLRAKSYYGRCGQALPIVVILAYDADRLQQLDSRQEIAALLRRLGVTDTKAAISKLVTSVDADAAAPTAADFTPADGLDGDGAVGGGGGDGGFSLVGTGASMSSRMHDGADVAVASASTAGCSADAAATDGVVIDRDSLGPYFLMHFSDAELLESAKSIANMRAGMATRTLRPGRDMGADHQLPGQVLWFPGMAEYLQQKQRVAELLPYCLARAASGSEPAVAPVATSIMFAVSGESSIGDICSDGFLDEF